MELLQQQLHSASDQDIGENGVGIEDEEEDDSVLGARPLDLENPLEVCAILKMYSAVTNLTSNTGFLTYMASERRKDLELTLLEY